MMKQSRRTRMQVQALEDRSLPAPVILDPSLDVRTVTTGLVRPTTLAFLGDNDFLVLQKDNGQVKRVVDGAVQGTVLDLNVNNNFHRGLLGIALHPQFEQKPWVYLSWSESSTAGDSSGVSEVAFLGNRVDRFVWDGSQLQFDRNILRSRALQTDAVAPGGPGFLARHYGGPLAFGNDHKLYYVLGDVNRRGWLQNVQVGSLPNGQDDEFGGPQPDDAHLSSAILRFNDDGTAAPDNPFWDYGRRLGGEVGANLQKVFAYGIKNSFSLAIDPLTGRLWDSETGDDAFTEINQVERGQNSGWVQIQGPLDRYDQFRAIENGNPFPAYAGLGGQLRYPASNLAATAEEALARLYVLPGSHYADPQFSWKFELPGSGMGFVASRALGREYEGDLFTGGALPTAAGGQLFRFNLSANRKELIFDDPRLEDRVADNTDKFDLTESESLLIGRDFGALTHIVTGPNGNVFVVAITNGAVYEIFRREGAAAGEVAPATSLPRLALVRARDFDSLAGSAVPFLGASNQNALSTPKVSPFLPQGERISLFADMWPEEDEILTWPTI